MRVLTGEAMREVERFAIERVGVPGLVLMEHAAIGVADAIGERFPEAWSAAIFCGPGNNGGDGLAVARLLDARGYSVEILLAVPGTPRAGDAEVQAKICRRLGLEIREIRSEAELTSALSSAMERDLIVDALFGTGLGRPLEGLLGRLAASLGDLGRPVLAVDLPSGLSADSGRLLGPHVTASLTVTFGVPKVAHLFSPAAEAVGELVIADLGIPARLFDSAAGDLRLLTEEHLGQLLQPRAREGHKGTYGHTLVVAGSKGKSGAALLATRAAVRAGSGLVTVAVPEDLLTVLEASSLESMTIGLPIAPDGGLGAGALDRLLTAAEGKSVLAVGPGLGTEPSTVEVVRRLIAETRVPVVLDADGLNAFQDRIAELASRESPMVLTPHPAELARLLGGDRDDVTADRAQAVRDAVERSGAVVVLKGHRTLIGDADGIAVNPTGNPGMATGGTGDILTGLIAGLIAQGREPVEAAELGVFAHGLAGDLAAERLGELSLSAGDVLERIPDAFEALRPR